MTISPNAVPSRVFVLMDRVAGKMLRDLGGGVWGFAVLNDPERDVTEFTDEADARHAAMVAGGDVKVVGLTKWVEP